jgi:hypothetical protein
MMALNCIRGGGLFPPAVRRGTDDGTSFALDTATFMIFGTSTTSIGTSEVSGCRGAGPWFVDARNP